MLSDLLNVEYGYFWLLLGIVLLILETMGAALALGSIGMAAILTGVVAFLGWLELTGLLAVFAVLSLGLFFASRPLADRLTGNGKSARTNVAALVGRTAVVTQEIGGISRAGYVRVAGDEWRCLPVRDETIAAGAHVRILRLEGSTLYVEPAIADHTQEKNA